MLGRILLIYGDIGSRLNENKNREQALFGKIGFHKIVAEVAGTEEILQIHSLAEFTPKGE